VFNFDVDFVFSVSVGTECVIFFEICFAPVNLIFPVFVGQQQLAKPVYYAFYFTIGNEYSFVQFTLNSSYFADINPFQGIPP
jgi:hypothetical protein